MFITLHLKYLFIYLFGNEVFIYYNTSTVHNADTDSVSTSAF